MTKRWETYGGITDTVAGHARRYGRKPKLVRNRLNDGWPLGDALLKPKSPNSRLYQIHGAWRTAEECAEIVGITKSAMHCRIRRAKAKGIDPADVMLLKRRQEVDVREHARMYEYRGEMWCVSDLAAEAGTGPSTMRSRLKVMTVEEAVAHGPRVKKKKRRNK